MITLTSKQRQRLTVSLTQEQYEYLKDQKERFGLTYSSQIRTMITDKIEGFVISETVRTTTRAYRIKTPIPQEVKSITSELQDHPIFKRNRERYG